MTEKKNIDRLFQEKFKDFERFPNESVWENISNELHPKKKRRRLIPIWWRVAGVAASFVLLITIGKYMFFDNDINSKTIVNTDSKTTIENTNSIEKGLKPLTPREEDNKRVTVIDSNNEKSDQNTHNKNTITKFQKPSTTQIANPSNVNTVIARTNPPTTTSNNVSESVLKNDLNTSDVITSKTDEIATKAQTNIDTQVAVTIGSEEKIISETQNQDIITEENSEKLSIDEGIAIAEALDDDILKNEEKDRKKWQITPSVGPVLFNSLGNSGSLIGNQFNDNSKSSNLNLSYGLSASYAVSKRLSVRTGVNKVNLGFNTNDVLIFNNALVASSANFSSIRTNNQSFLRNIDLNSSSQETSIINATDFKAVIAPNFSESNASIDQRFGFIEVPVELKYAVLDKKLGVSFIGGFSALFLDNNEVFSVNNGQTTLIGEANNINNTSYSANFGLGVNYKFSKAFNFNIEPTFKYQLNTFENTTGDFQPYFIGIYSGLIFNF